MSSAYRPLSLKSWRRVELCLLKRKEVRIRIMTRKGRCKKRNNPQKKNNPKTASHIGLQTDDEDEEEDIYISAEHVHVFAQAEVVVAVAVLLVLVEHVGVGDLFAPGGFVL